jgi:hypothetical protein
VTAHGGRVEVSSGPGQTRFTTHLPLSGSATTGQPGSRSGETADAQVADAQVATSTSKATSSRSEENIVTARSTASATASAN